VKSPRADQLMGQVKSIKHKRCPLVQGGLEIPVKVAVHWGDERALETLKRKTEEVNYGSQLSSRGDGVSRSIKRHFKLGFKRKRPVR